MSSTTVRDRTGTGLVASTIHIPDVRSVWRMFENEANVIINESQVPVYFDVEKAMLDIGVMALKDLISQVDITFYVDDTVVRRYVFRIADSNLQAWGPAPGQPPLAYSYPAGTKVRISVYTNEENREEADNLYKLLGWTTSKPLNGGGNASTYGTFVSGSYAWDRAVYINPDLDKGTRK